jgi:hypothetical protein
MFSRFRRARRSRRSERLRELDPLERGIALALFASTYPPLDDEGPPEYGTPGYRACLESIESDARTAAAAARKFCGKGPR